MRPRVLAAIAGASLALISACSASSKANADTTSVVVAFYPIEVLAQRIGGERIAITDLTPPGAEPHDLELRPSDLEALHSAGVVLYLALGFQPAVDRAIGSLADKSRAVDLLSRLPLTMPQPGAEAGLAADPHAWLSPPLYKQMATHVADALAQRLPADAKEFRSREAALAADIDALDSEYRTQLARCVRRDIFTSHAAFGYLAQRYGLHQVAVTGLSPEAEPSSKRLQEVARLAQASGATTIFFESLVSPRVSQTVARIVGARTAVLDPIEGLTAAERSAGQDYFTIMRANLRALVEALGCHP